MRQAFGTLETSVSFGPGSGQVTWVQLGAAGPCPWLGGWSGSLLTGTLPSPEDANRPAARNRRLCVCQVFSSPFGAPALGSTLTVLTSTLLHSEGDPPVRLPRPLAPCAVSPASVASPLGELLCRGQGTQADTRAATGFTPSSCLQGHCPLLLDMLCLEISHFTYFIWFYFFIIWFVLNLLLAATSSCTEVEGFLLSKIKTVYLETLAANKFK